MQKKRLNHGKIVGNGIKQGRRKRLRRLYAKKKATRRYGSIPPDCNPELW